MHVQVWFPNVSNTICMTWVIYSTRQNQWHHITLPLLGHKQDNIPAQALQELFPDLKMMSEHLQTNQAASQNHAQNQSTPKKLKCLRIEIQKTALKLIKIYKKNIDVWKPPTLCRNPVIKWPIILLSSVTVKALLTSTSFDTPIQFTLP